MLKLEVRNGQNNLQNITQNVRSLFIGDLKSGELWKGLEWKKIMSGWVKKGYDTPTEYQATPTDYQAIPTTSLY